MLAFKKCNNIFSFNSLSTYYHKCCLNESELSIVEDVSIYTWILS